MTACNEKILFELESCTSRGYPYATSLSRASYIQLPPCTACGTRYTRGSGAWSANLEGSTKKWPDILPAVGDVFFIVSERVAQSLRDCTGVTFSPVTLINRHKTSYKTLPPQYYVPEVTGRIELDLAKSGWVYSEICVVCGRCNLLQDPQNFMPDMSTWDGSDFCCPTNVIVHTIFCTARVLHLAHEQRWTNALFLLMGTGHNHPDRTKGIDYLAKSWPPNSWELADPLARKSIFEWSQDLTSDDKAVRYDAMVILGYLGEQALPAIIPLLRSTNQEAVRIAVNLLERVDSRTPLDHELRERVRKLKALLG